MKEKWSKRSSLKLPMNADVRRIHPRASAVLYLVRAPRSPDGSNRLGIRAGRAGKFWGGVLSTPGGLVFFGDDSGAFALVNARTGKPLWHFHTNRIWNASPMTYMVDDKQYVAIAAGSNIVPFTLPSY